MQYVAWIDILGTRRLIFDGDRNDATRLLTDLESTVKNVLGDSGDLFKVVGVNDGFYLIAEDLNRLCNASIAIFQRWFDSRANSLDNRPLLRGAIALLDEFRPAATQKPIIYWAFAPGLGVTYETEGYLAGSRLFAHPTLHDRNFPQGLVFSWKELSQSDLRVEANRQLLELFWPIGGNQAFLEVFQRLQLAKNLYDSALKKWENPLREYLAGKREDTHESAKKIYMQYEETLKLCIRSAGKFAAGNSWSESEKNELFKYIKTFANYRPDYIAYTWGLCFAGLWACWAAKLNQQEIFDTAHNFLNQGDGQWLGEFKKELCGKSTYNEFWEWLSAQDSRFAC